jgi:transcriptional regulator with XRE-family HTH domain
VAQEWRSILRDTRVRLGVTQAQLGKQIGVSKETIRGYETRTTRPSRERLEALIFALKIPNAVANEIRESAGYTLLKTVHRGPHEQHRYYTLEELDAVVETVPWPEFVVNDATEVVAANAAVQALWHIDFAHERSVRTRAQMNLLAVASDIQFADRVKNWEECVGILISMFKADIPEPLSLDNPSPYFEEVIKEFIKGDPAFLSRLFDVWTRTEPMEGKIRWTYPVVWDDPTVGEMHFLATVSLANEEHSTFFNDWIPVDAETWQRLASSSRRSLV